MNGESPQVKNMNGFVENSKEDDMLATMAKRENRAQRKDGAGPEVPKSGRPSTPYEREHFSCRIRSELMDLVREEMRKQRPMPDKNSMLEVILEDGLIARGYDRDRMPWLNEES